MSLQNKYQKILLNSVLVLTALAALSACSKVAPVAVSECDTVVKHATKVLGKFAPAESEMMAQCKAATDEARGCVMAANKPMKMSQCDF